MARFPARCPTLAAVLDALQAIAPLQLADSAWDNVGLLFEGVRPVRRILLAVDLTEPVAVQAAAAGYDMVIAYHPPWFRPAKSLTMEGGREARALAYLAARGISVFAPHTALDNVRPGINDWVLRHLFAAADDCPAALPNTTDSRFGAGRLLTLAKPVALRELVGAVAAGFGTPTLRYTLGLDHTLDTPISTVAVCVGSGASVLHKTKADLHLTGEMSHHDLLRSANELGASVVLTEHSTMERAFLFGPFCEQLRAALSSAYTVECSPEDRDPVRFFQA